MSSPTQDDADGDGKQPQPWYFHVVASLILVVHGFTFLVPSDPESEDTDMVRTVAKWFGYECEWVKVFTPYAQVGSFKSGSTVLTWQTFQAPPFKLKTFFN